MANKVWSWFKKIGHYIGVGFSDAEKFAQAVEQSNILTLLPGGGVVQAGLGVFEHILGGVKQVEVANAAAGNVATGPQKLIAATPAATQALLTFANTAGLKITDPAKFQVIAATLTSLGADFWNIVQPATGDKLPTPNVPVTPAAPTAPSPTTAT